MPELESKRFDCRADIPRVEIGEIRSNSKNNIRGFRILFLRQSKRFSYDSFDAISLHRTTDFPMNTYSYPAGTRYIRQANQCKAFTVQTLPIAIYFLKLPFLPDQGGFRKSLLYQWLRGKSLPTFGPSCSDHCLACTSTHSFAKSVSTFALDVTWLKSSLAHFLYPHCKKCTVTHAAVLASETRRAFQSMSVFRPSPNLIHPVVKIIFDYEF